MNGHRHFLLLVIFCAGVTAWSLIRPFDYKVWLFEIVAGCIGVAALALTYRRFPFSGLVYLLVGLHFAVLATGAKYSYAEMPLFNWLRDVLGLSRNHFDRVGHFFQGFTPAILTREVLLRTTGLRRGKMLGFLCIGVCLAASAFWELLEWWVVIFFYPESGQEWLGLQGDPWDPHQDMLMALLGATLSTLALSRLHDRSMKSATEAHGNTQNG
jgi:putative membrane protein